MARQTRVGLLVLVALVLFASTVLYLGQQQHVWERKVEYRIHFARTNGLQEGSQVSLSGVPVGSVTDMHLPADPDVHHIVVTVEVTRAVAPRIRENTLASIRTFGLLGDRYVELASGTAAADVLPPGAVIPSIDPVDYEAVLGQSGDIVTNVVEVTAALRDVLQTIQRGEGLLGAMVRNREFGESMLADLRASLTNVQETSDALARILGRIDRGEGLVGRLVRDTAETRTLLARLDRAARGLETFTGRLNGGQGALPRLVADRAYADRVLGDLQRSVASLDAILARLERGEGTLGRLLVDPSLYQEAHGLVAGVRRNWLLRLYRGIGALWPFGNGEPAAPPPAAAR